MQRIDLDAPAPRRAYLAIRRPDSSKRRCRHRDDAHAFRRFARFVACVGIAVATTLTGACDSDRRAYDAVLDTAGTATDRVPPRPASAPAPGAGEAAAPDAAAIQGPARQDSTRVRTITASSSVVKTPATLLDSAAIDLDRDGEVEQLLLYAAVDRDDRGRLMWDDGQRWLLLARDGDREYVLFDGFVQLGRLGFHAIESGDDRPPLLVLQEETGSGIRVWTFAWDGRADAFRGSLVLEATGNVVHATRPLGGA